MRLQSEVDELVRALGGYWKPFEMLAALVEETGELADAMLALEGVKGKGSKEPLVEEIGDVLFALACIANHYEIDLEAALKATIEKYRRRDIPFDKD